MKITITDHATPELERKIARLGSRRELHATMGLAVETLLGRHIRGKVAPRPNRLGAPSTGFWKKAADSIVGTADDRSATVSIPSRGVALQYYGGRVRPTTREWLTIPIHAMGHGRSAREIGVKLYLFQSKKGNLILATDPNPRTRGGARKPGAKRRKLGGYRGGIPVYVLKQSSRILPHPEVLPTELEIRAAAVQAAEDYFLEP